MDITEGLTGIRLRKQLAQAAYCLAPNKKQVEKSVKVDNSVFEQCLVGMPEHHKDFNRKRGFLRTYHEPFWTENKEGMGRTYHMGVVHVINRDSEINTTYEVNPFNSEDIAREVDYAVRVLGHRIIDIYSGLGEAVVVLTPQRWNLNGD